jgi:hypothetical protein
MEGIPRVNRKITSLLNGLSQNPSMFCSDKGIEMFALIIGTVDSLLNTKTLIRPAAPVESTFSISRSTL